ncbi:MAG TPA: hypothetical protein VFZ65_19690 [Planctomycetota bacterium]|nr:hypothetical protein [Planctomycetota bacterium]
MSSVHDRERCRGWVDLVARTIVGCWTGLFGGALLGFGIVLVVPCEPDPLGLNWICEVLLGALVGGLAGLVWFLFDCPLPWHRRRRPRVAPPTPP